ncbi:hypothetical protein F441_11214 [Phytophthora nicotianae CJ01A1]|uniref:Uncharacterized protein n=1 Tax=Phytophthora nicotianae CJ01A1 TaxID=1317063 RepID=W2WVX4_PHYNI|nr:hypothetical protein F441_11214 [Phytophthora nicotianae CJ01A1]
MASESHRNPEFRGLGTPLTFNSLLAVMRVNEEILLRHMMKKTPSKRKKLPYLVLLHDGAIDRPLIPNIVFSLASFTDANCELEFHFDIGDGTNPERIAVKLGEYWHESAWRSKAAIENAKHTWSVFRRCIVKHIMNNIMMLA